MNRQLVVPFLWYNSGAEDAARFYVSLFPDSGILDVVRCGPGGPGPEGSALTVEFRLAGVHYVALNGGPHYRLNEAFSLSVPCDTQEEIDRLWTALCEGGEPGRCGWLKDRFGLSWQVVPRVLPQLLSGKSPGAAARARQAMLQMTKLDIDHLQRAHDGR